MDKLEGKWRKTEGWRDERPVGRDSESGEETQMRQREAGVGTELTRLVLPFASGQLCVSYPVRSREGA